MIKSKALFLVGKEKFQIGEIPLRPLQNHEVLLKIKACGICGTDLSYVGIDYHTPANPAVLGHEFVGIIEDVGSWVQNVKKGDRVLGESAVYCGRCEFCVSGNNHFCNNAVFYGNPPLPGGFQEYLIMPADFVFKIPDSMSFPLAVLVEPLAVCLHALNLANFRVGMDAAVIGCGAIGLLTIKLLRLAGANRIFACDPVFERQEMALKMGADFVSSPYEKVFINLINEHTNNLGVERVFEAAGKSPSMTLTTRVAKNGGELIIIGVNFADTFNISQLEANAKGLTIKMVRRLKNTLHRAIEITNNHQELEELVTTKFGFADAEKTFIDAKNYRNGIIKAVFEN